MPGRQNKPFTGADFRELRRIATNGAGQRPTARLAGISRGTVENWEAEPTTGGLPEGYMYVGLAFRTGGPRRALDVLRFMSQYEVDGLRVALRRPELANLDQFPKP